MRLFFFTICFSFLFATSALAWQTLEDGLFYKKTSVITKNYPVVIHALKIDLKHFNIRPVYNKAGLFAQTHTEEQNAVAVINANFFDPDGNVLGLVKREKITLHPKKDVSWWSIFCVTDSTAQIMHQSKYDDALCHNAIEAGPRLVINGKIPNNLKNENSLKTAVGINKQGAVILVVTTSPIAITELARLFVLAENGFDCPNAMNLDGGSSTQLYVKTNTFELNVPSLIKFPAGLGVFFRK